MPLTAPVKSSLSGLQDAWLQWDSAFQRGDEVAARGAVDDLLQTAGELGMSRLPELSFAVLERAALSAADGSTPRARWALEMAERLDPGRPEVAFAAATVARHQRHFPTMLAQELRGYARTLSVPLFARLTAENLLVWLLATVLLSGSLFVALQLAVHGGSLIEDTVELVARRRPITTAYLVALVVLILPALVPAAWIALPLYWAVLLWPYARRSERAVLSAVVATLVATPLLLAAQTHRVQVELSPPMKAVRSLAERRLYGALVHGVDALEARLESAPAALQVMADLHLDFGQIEYARLYYQRLAEIEPLNVAAHNNLGTYYLRRRETSRAIEELERAASIDPSRIEPHRNLWVLYRDYLAFEEAERVLARVRNVAPGGVSDWFSAGPATVAVMRDGYGRMGEIRKLLRAQSEAEAEAAEALPLSSGRTIAVAVFIVIAVAAAVVLSRSGAAPQRASRRRSEPPRLALQWVPGLRALASGRGVRAYLALAFPVGVMLLPRLASLGYRLPWGFNPGPAGAWLAGAVAVLWVIVAGLGRRAEA